MNSSQAPVALFIFNRPEVTKRVLDVIASVEPRRLFVIADGPRTDHPDDARLVAETRAVIDRADWPTELVTDYSDVNLGCLRRIASGLDWVFEHASKAIILEDDCLPHPTFFRYCDELLELYDGRPEVHMISGSNVLGERGAHSYFFSRSFNIWGWATWAWAWERYDEDMRPWAERRDTKWLDHLLQDAKGARVAKVRLDAAEDGARQWDFHWAFRGWLSDAVSIVPSVNLVENLGFGEHATHMRNARHPHAGRAAEAMTFPLKHPPAIAVEQDRDRAIWAATYRRAFPSAQARGWHRIRKFASRAREAIR
jgi:hypothetical protein